MSVANTKYQALSNTPRTKQSSKPTTTAVKSRIRERLRNKSIISSGEPKAYRSSYQRRRRPSPKRDLDFMEEQELVVSTKAWNDLQERLQDSPSVIPALQELLKDANALVIK